MNVLNKLKKVTFNFTVILLSLLMLVTNVADVHAESITLITQSTNNRRYGYSYKGYNPATGVNGYIRYNLNGVSFFYSNTGDDLFCIEPWAYVDNGQSMSSVSLANLNLTEEMRERLSLVGYYGWYSSAGTDDDRVATQFMVWEARGYNWTEAGDLKHTPIQDWFVAKKAEINKKIEDHYKTTSFNDSTITLKVGESHTFTDTNGVLSNFMKSHGFVANTVKVINGNQFFWDGGNELTITANATSTDGRVSFKNVPPTNDGGNGINLVFQNGNVQKLSRLNQVDPTFMRITVNTVKQGYLTIAKVNDSNQPVPNTQFVLSAKPDMSTPIGTYSTGADGTVTVSDLTAGTYYIKETNVPAPLVLDPAVKTVTVVAGQTTSFTVVNKAAQGKITITKQGENEVLAGTVYDVLNAQGTVVDTITTGTDGNATSKALPLGNYTLVETFVPAPYVLDPKPIAASLVYKDQTTSVVSTSVAQSNVKALGRITITKQGENEVLAGTVYDVLNAQGTVVDTITTGTDGKATSKALPLGNYKLVEKKVPSPYLLDATPIAVSLVYKDQTTSVVSSAATQSNKKAQGAFVLTKTDAENAETKLEGAVYELRNVENTLVDTLTADANGQAKSKVLPLGKYTLKEVKAPLGYNLDPTTHELELTFKDDKTPVVEVGVDLVNHVIKGRIQVVKVDANNEEIPVEGAKFGVYHNDTQELIEEIVSDRDGFAHTSLLRYGNYYIQELEAPAEFYLNPNKYPVTIREHGKTVVQYIANDQILIKLNIQKDNSDTKEPLAGAVFEIHDSEGKVVEFEYLNDKYEIVKETKLVTNEKGQAFTRGFLKYGSYTLVEVEAPKGFVKAEPIAFTIDRDTEFINLDVIGKTTVQSVSNTPITVEVVKVNLDKEFVEGASLQLTDASGKVVLEWESDGSPQVFKGLTIGESYTLTELKAPKGYLLSDPITFEVKETKEVQTIEMVDEYIPELKTKALFDGQRKEGLATTEKTVIDEVSYSKVVIGKEYTVKGKLLDVETQEVVATGETTFVAEKTEGVVQVVFKFDGSKLAGRTFVVFEDLYQGERLVATHNELTDKDQTVYFPKVSTTATTQDGQKEVHASERVTLVDKVEYTNLQINGEYTLKGELVRKDTKEVLATAEKIFTAKYKSGIETLTFTFDASQLKGQEVVVFERLYKDEVEIATHVDINDLGQTVRIVKPDVKTKVAFHHRDEAAPKMITLIDQVQFKDLIVGKKYTVKGILMDKTTGEPLVINDKEVTSELTFVAETKDGTVELPFTFDSSKLTKGDVVVFERLYQDEIEVATHTDLEDKDQTVSFVEIQIKKVDSLTKNVLKNAEFTLMDENGKVIEVKETDENGLATFVVIEGTYQLKETKAPAGYRLSEEVIKVTVDGTEKDHHYQMTALNTPLPDELAKTGTESTVIFTASGLLLVSVGLIILLKRKKQMI